MPAFSPPLLPDADDARQWASDELSRRVYHDDPSLLEWLWEKFLELLDRIISAGSGLDSAFVPLMILAVIAAVVVLAIMLAGPLQRSTRHAPGAGAVIAEDDARSAADMREAAQRALRAGDYPLAAIEQFRAIVRRLSDRAILDVAAGMTASEVAAFASEPFPDLSGELAQAARVFNRALYGEDRKSVV